MPKTDPLALHAIIPDKASAIAFDGGAGDKCRLVLDMFSEQPACVRQLKNGSDDLLVSAGRARADRAIGKRAGRV